MLQVLNLHQPSFACGILFLVAELEGAFPDLKTLLTEPEANEEDEEEVFRDVDDSVPASARRLPSQPATVLTPSAEACL